MKPRVQFIQSLALLLPHLMRQNFIQNHRSCATGVTGRTYSMNSTGIARGALRANTIFARGATVLVEDAFIGMASGMQRCKDTNEMSKTHRNRKIHYLLIVLLDIDTGNRAPRCLCRRLPKANGI